MPSFRPLVYSFSGFTISNVQQKEKRRDGHDGGEEEGGGDDPGSGKPTSKTSTTTHTVTTPTLSNMPSPSPSSTNLPLVFDDPSNVTVCNTLELSWTYNNQTEVDITLTIQSHPSPFSSSSPSNASLSMTSTPIFALTTTASSNADSYIWSPVDVPTGWYSARAFDTSSTLNITAESTPFFVLSGPDMSCLAQTSTTSTAIPSTTPSMTNNSSSRFVFPAGDIAGLSIGATGGVLCLVVAIAYLRNWKKDIPNNDRERRRPRFLY